MTIQGNIHITPLHVLEGDSIRTYHLTGSRFFECEGLASDFDFFVQEDSTVGSFLVENGFEIISKTPYDDSQVVSVYRHPFGVDIQIVKSAEIKHNAQELLKSLGYRRPSKRSWNAAINYVTK